MTDDEYNLLFHKTQANISAFKRLMDCDAEVIEMIEAAVEPEIKRLQELYGKTERLEVENKRLQELANYRLTLLTKMPSDWVPLTDQEINDCLTFNFETICRNVEAKLKEKNT